LLLARIRHSCVVLCVCCVCGGGVTTDHPVHRDSMGTERTGVRESRPGQDALRQSLVAAEVRLLKRLSCYLVV
jgi:hypothetical protein